MPDIMFYLKRTHSVNIIYLARNDSSRLMLNRYFLSVCQIFLYIHDRFYLAHNCLFFTYCKCPSLCPRCVCCVVLCVKRIVMQMLHYNGVFVSNRKSERVPVIFSMQVNKMIPLRIYFTRGVSATAISHQ